MTAGVEDRRWSSWFGRDGDPNLRGEVLWRMRLCGCRRGRGSERLLWL
jgi:hypothetical protein